MHSHQVARINAGSAPSMLEALRIANGCTCTIITWRLVLSSKFLLSRLADEKSIPVSYRSIWTPTLRKNVRFFAGAATCNGEQAQELCMIMFGKAIRLPSRRADRLFSMCGRVDYATTQRPHLFPLKSFPMIPPVSILSLKT